MPTCFVLAPTRMATPSPTGAADAGTAPRSALLYEEVVRPVCEQFGFRLVRADREPGSGLLSERSLRHLVEEDVVVADLSCATPDVVHSLRVRRATGRRTVHLHAADGAAVTDLPLPAVEFSPLPGGAADARHRLADALVEAFGVAAPRPPAPTSALAPVTHPAPDDPSREEGEGPGMFDLAAAAETAMESITDDMADLDAAFADFAAMGTLIGEEMSRLDAGAPMSARLAMVNRFAKAIEGPADEMEASATRFAARMEVAAEAMNAFLRWMRDTPRDEWPDTVDAMLDDMVVTAREMREATTALQQFMSLMEMLGTVSRRLRRPTRRVGATMRTLFGTVQVFEEWAVTATELRQQR
ncbi:hypothetical protein [Streptomyces lichenis]|uniref:Uncharacterized protein n=1 Tax=Streptomyces lichenis TaxID=2306967 RepID=A0ABT0I770_9ACTN|nr:hypothetical protein [Streptomyces lichenis]MCK8677142.1 hypothetical protein [Streptomyces lichenis]